MRLCEFLLLAVAIAGAWLFRRAITANQKPFGMLGIAIALPLIAAGLQAFVEHPRWQLVPCYVSLILMGVSGVLYCRPDASSQSKQKLAHNLLLFNAQLIIASTVLTLLVPIASLPSPTGPYQVGTATYHVVDQSRREQFCLDHQRRRELMMQVWYPATKSLSKRLAPFMAYCSDPKPFFTTPIWAVLASHLSLIPTGSQQSAPMAVPAATERVGIKPSDERGWPVLIFSHGLMGGRIQNTVEAQELASHGFVVVCIDHTYDASFTIVSEHENIPSALLVNSLSPKGSAAKLLRDDGLAMRVRDVMFVLDELYRLNVNDPQSILAQHLDLTRVGLYGHSFGGATALAVCAADKRIRAGLSMDSAACDERTAAQVKQPFLFIQAKRQGDPLGINRLCEQMKNPWWVISIDGTGHGNFTDLPFLTPVHQLSMLTGPLDPSRAMQIIDEYTLAFFDQVLNGIDSALLQQTNGKYPEVTVIHSNNK